MNQDDIDNLPDNFDQDDIFGENDDDVMLL